MFTFIKSDSFNEKMKLKLEEKGVIPVVLFSIEVGKSQFVKNNVEQILIEKKRLNPKYSAIKVILREINNSTAGIVNNLKRDFDLVIGFGGLNKINRFFLENTQVDFLLDPQNSFYLNKHDFIHHFNGGLNHVLCKMGQTREIDFIYSLNFFDFYKHQVPKEIGRVNQNLMFHNKYKNDVYLNFIVKTINQIKSSDEVLRILEFFDMSTINRKNSVDVVEKKIMRNKFKKSDNFICDGIEKID